MSGEEGACFESQISYDFKRITWMPQQLHKKNK